MPSETKMDKYDAILHYPKSNTININNNANTGRDQTRSKTSPTLQVKIPNTQTRITHSISSDKLAKSTKSFKSFKNMQQSWKRSHTNSCTDNMDEILGTSWEIYWK